MDSDDALSKFMEVSGEPLRDMEKEISRLRRENLSRAVSQRSTPNPNQSSTYSEFVQVSNGLLRSLRVEIDALTRETSHAIS